MHDAPVSPSDVVTWINEALADYQGLYDVQDLTFIRKTVRVVTPRRDALYDIANTRWGSLADPNSRPRMTEDLLEWARHHLVPRH